jgi:hypothetical protein
VGLCPLGAPVLAEHGKVRGYGGAQSVEAAAVNNNDGLFECLTRCFATTSTRGHSRRNTTATWGPRAFWSGKELEE